MELLRSRSASHVSLSGVSSQSSVGLVRSASQGLLSPLRALSAEIRGVLILIGIRPQTGCQSVRFCELQPEESCSPKFLKTYVWLYGPSVILTCPL